MQAPGNPPFQIELLPRARVLNWVFTRTRSICKFCTPPCHKYAGYGYSIFTPARNFCDFCTPVPQYPERLEVLYDFHTRTRNFWKFCKTFTPVPGTSVSSVQPVPQYPGDGYGNVLHPLGTSVSYVRLCHTTRNFCELCNTSIPIPETSGSSVRLLYPFTRNAHTLQNITSKYLQCTILEK